MICPRFELGSLEAGARRSRPRSRSGRSTRAPTRWPPRSLADWAPRPWPSTRPCRSSPSTACGSAAPDLAAARRRARRRRLPDDQVAGRAGADEPGQGHDAGGPPPRRAHPGARDHHHAPSAASSTRRTGRWAPTTAPPSARCSSASPPPIRTACPASRQLARRRHRADRHRLQGRRATTPTSPAPTSSASRRAEQRRVWEVEKRAQAAAFAAVKPGVACEEIDAVARRVLAAAGFGPDYELPGLPHRTGHGIGLVDPRGALSGARRQDPARARHVLLQRADDRHPRRLRRPAGGPLLCDRRRRGLVHRAAAQPRRAVSRPRTRLRRRPRRGGRARRGRPAPSRPSRGPAAGSWRRRPRRDISAAEATPTRTAEASGRDSAKPSAACSGSERPSAIRRRARLMPAGGGLQVVRRPVGRQEQQAVQEDRAQVHLDAHAGAARPACRRSAGAGRAARPAPAPGPA